MGFTTKLDFSSNRQVKQYPETITQLSGATSFGVPFSALTTGPDPNFSGVSSTQSNVISTFSGNTGTTVYTWYDNRMQLAISHLSAWTPSNSGITQNTGNVFTASTTSVIDGNTVALTYTGVSFDVTVAAMISLGGGAYSGSVVSEQFDILTAGTLDFTGRTIWVDVSGITRTDSLIVNTSGATFSSIGAGASAGALHYTAGGVLTTNTSDERLKIKISPISNALSKVLALNGVYYNWREDPDGDRRVGFIAQDVIKVIPELTFINRNSPDNMLGVHYDNMTSLLVEAIKELVSGGTISTTKTKYELKTQTIIAEDNNIELNFNGNHETAIGGGIIVLKALNNGDSARFVIDNNSNWITNINLKPFSLSIPRFTGYNNFTDGNIFFDDEFIYIKVNDNWKKVALINI